MRNQFLLTFLVCKDQKNMFQSYSDHVLFVYNCLHLLLAKQCQKLTHVLLCSHVNNMLFIYVIQYRKSFINILEGVKYLRLKFRLHSPTFLLHSKR